MEPLASGEKRFLSRNFAETSNLLLKFGKYLYLEIISKKKSPEARFELFSVQEGPMTTTLPPGPARSSGGFGIDPRLGAAALRAPSAFREDSRSQAILKFYSSLTLEPTKKSQSV